MYVTTPTDIAAKFGRIGLRLSHVAISYYIRLAPGTVVPEYNWDDLPYCRLSLVELTHTAPDVIRLLYNIQTKSTTSGYGRRWRYYPEDGALNCTSVIEDHLVPISAAEEALALELLGAVI